MSNASRSESTPSNLDTARSLLGDPKPNLSGGVGLPTAADVATAAGPASIENEDDDELAVAPAIDIAAADALMPREDLGEYLLREDRADGTCGWSLLPGGNVAPDIAEFLLSSRKAYSDERAALRARVPGVTASPAADSLGREGCARC